MAMIERLYVRLCALPQGIRIALLVIVLPWVIAYAMAVVALTMKWTGVVAFWMPAS